jgi:hypothetical protein
LATLLTPAIDPWAEVGWLPCQLNLEIPVHGFRVRDLLQLTVGALVETQWKSVEYLPLRANHLQIGWVECELAGDHLAIRLTDLV